MANSRFSISSHPVREPKHLSHRTQFVKAIAL